MAKWPDLHNLIDHLFLDNMENDFILKTGAWPESYFLTDRDANITWKCTAGKNFNCDGFDTSAAESFIVEPGEPSTRIRTRSNNRQNDRGAMGRRGAPAPV